MLNSVCKGKYSKSLQQYPRLQSIIKALDVDVKEVHIGLFGKPWLLSPISDTLRS